MFNRVRGARVLWRLLWASNEKGSKRRQQLDKLELGADEDLTPFLVCLAVEVILIWSNLMGACRLMHYMNNESITIHTSQYNTSQYLILYTD